MSARERYDRVLVLSHVFGTVLLFFSSPFSFSSSWFRFVTAMSKKQLIIHESGVSLNYDGKRCCDL
jgi:hypothetical protein